MRWRERLILELPPDAEQEEVHTLSSCFLQHMIALCPLILFVFVNLDPAIVLLLQAAGYCLPACLLCMGQSLVATLAQSA